MSHETAQKDQAKVDLPVSMKWLEGVINTKTGSNAKLIETKCEIIGEGKGFLSVITRVQLKWEVESSGKTLPVSLIIKRPSLEGLSALDIDGAFAALMEEEVLREYHNRECDVYDLLTKYEDTSPIPIAACYYIQKRNDDERGMIIMEDISGVAKSLHFNDNLNESQTLTLIEHIASLQAYGFRHPDIMKTLTPLKKDPYLNMLDGIKDAVRGIREDYNGMLKYSDEQIDGFIAECLEDIKVSQDSNSKEFTTVICLGDIQPNNILWKISEDGTPSDKVVAFIDFQICHTSNCMDDIGIAMVSGMTTATRRSVTDKMHQRLVQILQDKSGSTEAISMAEVKRIYKKVLLKSGLICLSFAPKLAKMPESLGIGKGKDIDMLERCIAAIDDAIGM